MERLELLKNASSEIKSLRRQVEVMSARLQMFDSMMAVFVTTPERQSQGMSPDIVHYIDNEILNLQEKDPSHA